MKDTTMNERESAGFSSTKIRSCQHVQPASASSNTVTQMLLRIRVGLRTRHGSNDGMIDSLDRIRTTEVMNI
jgi:hypothetical protein